MLVISISRITGFTVKILFHLRAASDLNPTLSKVRTDNVTPNLIYHDYVNWYGLEWHGMAWHGMAWHGMASHRMT